MKTTPLLMTGGNIRLIQQELKTNTRRVCMARTQNQADIIAAAIMEDIYDADNGSHEIAAWKTRIKCPYGGPSDRLAIKETFWAWGCWHQMVDASTGKKTYSWQDCTSNARPILYDADLTETPKQAAHSRKDLAYHKRPSIYLPQTAWRIFLEITRVDVERLQSISEADAKDEGAYWLMIPLAEEEPTPATIKGHGYRMGYARLWDSINGTQRPGKPDISWKANPMVYSIHFRKLP